MSRQNSRQIENVKVMLLKGDKGQDGVTIESIEKTSSSGLVDTYTITFTDGSKSTFTITNGDTIESIEKTGTSGLVDTYTITMASGNTSTFTITNANSIESIAKTSTVGNVDTYTITMTDGSTATFNVTNGIGGGMSAKLIIASDAGSTVTVTTPSGDIKTATQKAGSTTLWECDTSEYGTHTINGVWNGVNYQKSETIDTCKIYNVSVIPKGATVTPTDNVQTWLKCANIWDKTYTTLSEVLADSTTLLALMSDNNAVDYLVRSKTWANDDSISLIPTMTSNTSPSGVASANSEYGGVLQAYKAFDGSLYIGSGLSSNAWIADGTTGWIQYKFDFKVCVKKIKYSNMHNGATCYHGQWKLQASNDNLTWTDLYSTTDENVIFTDKEIEIQNDNYYSIYRFTILSSYTNQVGLLELQLYGGSQITNNQTAMNYINANDYCAETLLADSTWLNAIFSSPYFETVLNVKVPTMTSNTSPSGTVIFSSQYSSSDTGIRYAYFVFNGISHDNANWDPASGETSSYIGYGFTSSKNIKIAKGVFFKNNPTPSVVSYKIQGSNDNSTWTDLLSYETLNVSNSSGSGDFIVTLEDNADEYLYYRVYFISSPAINVYAQYEGGMVELQFYGRASS